VKTREKRIGAHGWGLLETGAIAYISIQVKGHLLATIEDFRLSGLAKSAGRSPVKPSVGSAIPWVKLPRTWHVARTIWIGNPN
jgi:hypothetical protein